MGDRKKLSSSSSLNHFIVEIYDFRWIWLNCIPAHWSDVDRPFIISLLLQYNSWEISAPLMMSHAHTHLNLSLSNGNCCRCWSSSNRHTIVEWSHDSGGYSNLKFNREIYILFLFCHSNCTNCYISPPINASNSTRVKKHTANAIEIEGRNAYRATT